METLSQKRAVRVSLDIGVTKDKLEDYLKSHATLGGYTAKGNVKIEDLETINRRVRVRVTVTGWVETEMAISGIAPLYIWLRR